MKQWENNSRSRHKKRRSIQHSLLYKEGVVVPGMVPALEAVHVAEHLQGAAEADERRPGRPEPQPAPQAVAQADEGGEHEQRVQGEEGRVDAHVQAEAVLREADGGGARLARAGPVVQHVFRCLGAQGCGVVCRRHVGRLF